MTVASLFKEIKSFRLGYTEERPYPWRWTTPVVLGAFFLISPFLTLVNVPLSAYNIVQDPTDSFTPQLLHIGDMIMLDDHIFNYTIAQAFDGVDTKKPLSSFLYYNNPFSKSCNVANITVQMLNTELHVSGTIACNLPSLFYLTWDGFPLDYIQGLPIGTIPLSMSIDLTTLFTTWKSVNSAQIEISFTVHPCCNCDAVLAGAPLESGSPLLQPPCSSTTPNFVVVEVQAFPGHKPPYSDIFGHLPMQLTDLLATGEATGNLENISIVDLGTIYENLIQAVYHLVRVDLGVILDNQIYNSPAMFDRTIVALGNLELWANNFRDWTSDATLMAQWQQGVQFYQANERVPPLEYLRSVPRLKPVGSAASSVFVSTFAMLSVMWTVFSLVAGVLAKARGTSDETRGNKHGSGQSRKREKWLESGMEEAEGNEVLLRDQEEPDAVKRLKHRIDKNEAHVRNDIDVIQAALARLTITLQKHGLMEEDIVIG
ncbi:hypothetical protein C8R45DRAFT_1217323 [Mycena sanguinolenta]|nr:hypothetical protein C8R45DRAFT_1217323 [Mycena sanguinolenta]